MRAQGLLLVETVAARVKRLRMVAGLTQTELAKRAGVSISYLSRLEADQYANPSGPNLQRLAHELGVSTAYILGEPEPLPRESYPEDLLPLFDDLALLRASNPEAAAMAEAVVRTMIDEARRRAERERPRSQVS